MPGRFATSSNSNGQIWYGSTTGFPGFLYKKNLGVSGRRSTQFGAGGTMLTNHYTTLNNKYTPGSNGVGATTIANRRAKNRRASLCHDGHGHCGLFIQHLGRPLVPHLGQPYPL